MLSQRVDGLVMAIAMRDDPLIEYLLKAGMHTVLVNRADESGRLPWARRGRAMPRRAGERARAGLKARRR